MTATGSMAPTAGNGRVLFTLPLTLLIGVGTGGLWPSHLEQGTGGSINQCNVLEVARADRRSRPRSNATAADDIDYIKALLKLTTTELAKYLGVSRQAIYDWRSGSHVKSHNISKLENLRDAAAVIADAGSGFSALQLNRRLPGGRTMLETIALGGNGYEAAQSLVNMLRREGAERAARLTKVAGRKPSTESEFAPGMAAFQETG
jgi:transcriptional regulator with XRE-family HTH domain